LKHTPIVCPAQIADEIYQLLCHSSDAFSSLHRTENQLPMEIMNGSNNLCLFGSASFDRGGVMKKYLFIFLLLVGFPKSLSADTALLNLESWFDISNRGKIQHLQKELKAANEINMGGWDYTTVWDVRHRNYEFEGFRVMRLLTDSMDGGWMGCCYTHAAGLVLELRSISDLSKISANYDCYLIDESAAIRGLHFHNHSILGKSYVEMRCSTP
jgi:hypothetical protein